MNLQPNDKHSMHSDRAQHDLTAQHQIYINCPEIGYCDVQTTCMNNFENEQLLSTLFHSLELPTPNINNIMALALGGCV
jgi:hypothetical protein